MYNVNNVNNEIVVLMHVQGQHEPTAMQIDCGDSCNVFPEKYLPLDVQMSKTSKKLRMYSDHVVSVLGVCKLNVMNPKTLKSYIVPFYVVQGNRLPLIGSKAAQQMKLITVNKEHFTSAELDNIASVENESLSKVDKGNVVISDVCQSALSASDIFSEYKDVFLRSWLYAWRN